MSSSDGKEPRYGIEELAERGGVTRRTVRYYVQRGLLPAPTGTGRGPHYTEEHLATLVSIRQLQEQGVALSEIPVRLGQVPLPPGPEPEPLPAPVPELQRGQTPIAPAPLEPTRSLWTRIVLANGVELHLRGAAGGLHPYQLAALAEAARQILGARP